MRVICIAIPDEGDLEEHSDFVKYVALQMEEGFTSGHVNSDHYWSVEEAS